MNDEFEHNDNESYESDDTNTEDTYSNTESDHVGSERRFSAPTSFSWFRS